jgi:hypothetical protein
LSTKNETALRERDFEENIYHLLPFERALWQANFLYPGSDDLHRLPVARLKSRLKRMKLKTAALPASSGKLRRSSRLDAMNFSGAIFIKA